MGLKGVVLEPAFKISDFKGGQNSNFFHTTTVQCRARSRIQRIKGPTGNWIEAKDEIFTTILDHYKEVYKTDLLGEEENVANFISSIVTPNMNAVLMAPITEEKVKFSPITAIGSHIHQ